MNKILIATNEVRADFHSSYLILAFPQHNQLCLSHVFHFCWKQFKWRTCEILGNRMDEKIQLNSGKDSETRKFSITLLLWINFLAFFVLINSYHKPATFSVLFRFVSTIASVHITDFQVRISVSVCDKPPLILHPQALSNGRPNKFNFQPSAQFIISSEMQNLHIFLRMFLVRALKFYHTLIVVSFLFTRWRLISNVFKFIW